MLSLGEYHACAITTSGVLKCWGANWDGELGDGTGLDSITPKIIDAGTSYISVATASAHTCGVTSTFALKCWGYNAHGEIGDNTTFSKNIPQLIDSGTSYLKVAAGGSSTCAITLAGVLNCWGYNSEGTLGSGNTTDLHVPTAILGGTTYSDVGLGYTHACAIEAGTYLLYCWGGNSSGELGNGSYVNTTNLSLIDPVNKYSKIGLGAHSTQTLVIRDDHKLYGWGENIYGQLGDGAMIYNFIKPSYVPFLRY